MGSTAVNTSWLRWNGDAGKHFVDTPLKPPLQLRWKKKLKMPTHAMAHAGRVVVVCHGGIYTLDLLTGEEVWRVEEYGKKSYEHVLPAGDAEAVYFHARTEFRAVRWDTGEVIWSHKRKRYAIFHPEDPLVAGPYLFLSHDVLDARTGETVRTDREGHVHSLVAGDLLVRYRFDPDRLECLDVASGDIVCRTEYASQRIVAVNSEPGHISYSLVAGWDGHALTHGGTYDNAWWYLHEIPSGRILSQTPYQILPESWSLVERWTFGATDGRELFLFWTRDEHGASPGCPFQPLGDDLFSRPQAFSLPNFRCLWEGELMFHQSGGDAHVGSPCHGLLTRGYFWYVWRTANSENPKTYLAALNRADGRVAFQCTLGPWVAHIMAVDDALIVVGGGGTVFCYGEK